jgi:hypothetical protein
MLARQVLYYLKHSISPVFVLGILEMGSQKLFGWTGLKPK